MPYSFYSSPNVNAMPKGLFKGKYVKSFERQGGKGSLAPKPKISTFRGLIAYDTIETLAERDSVTFSGSGILMFKKGQMLQSLVIKSFSAQSISIGTTSGGTDIVNADLFSQDETKTYTLNIFFNTNASIYITATSDIEVYQVII